jgi:DNA replication and repair protein RecF
MYIEKINLLNFKNFEEVAIPLHRKVNCFVGNNGVGKTNLLDAVYYLCMTKSYFQLSDHFSIRHNADFLSLQASFNINGNTDEIHCALKLGNRKQLRKNKKEYPKLSDHIGNYPVVMVSPSDSTLITDGSEERRKYLNAVISQFDHQYLEDVILYNKVLAQRNKLLKELNRLPESDELLEIYNEQLIPVGNRIFEKRRNFVSMLTPVFKHYYFAISEGKENVDLVYSSQLTDNSFEDLILKSQRNDIQGQTTSSGVHKDDLELIMDANSIRKIGSQGQQKTFLVALKLAQFDFIRKIKNITPILLLDDIFDKFDVNRVMQILHLVSDDNFGQIFITHTNESRMRELLSGFPESFTLFRVENNNVIPVNS